MTDQTMAYKKQMIKINEEKERILKEKKERLKIDQSSTIKDRMMIITIALVLGICFDTFFIGHYWGVSVSIISLIFLYGVHFSVKEKHFTGMGYLFLGAIILLSGTFAIYNNLTLRFLNVLLLPIVFTAYTLSIRYPDWKYINVTYLLKIVEKLYPKSFGAIPKLFIFVHGLVKAKLRSEMSDSSKQIIGGLIVGLPLLGITILLLASADAVFSNYLSELTSFVELPRVDEFIGHLILITFVTLYTFGYLWSNQYDDLRYKKEVHVKKMIEPLTMLTIMGLLVLVYCFFTAIQFSYLYSGMGHLPNGLTYAEYARKGFFELVFVTVMNMSIILTGVLVTKNENIKQEKVLKVIYSIMILFTFNLLVSSFYRMNLYEKAYGSTELRLFVQFFIVFLGIAIISMMAWIWKREMPLFKMGVIAAVTVYLALNYVNVDRIIAKNNIERYLVEGEIDLDYLSYLSVDAYSTMIAFEKEHNIELTKAFDNYHEYDYEIDIKWYESNIYLYHYRKNIKALKE